MIRERGIWADSHVRTRVAVWSVGLTVAATCVDSERQRWGLVATAAVVAALAWWADTKLQYERDAGAMEKLASCVKDGVLQMRDGHASWCQDRSERQVKELEADLARAVDQLDKVKEQHEEDLELFELFTDPGDLSARKDVTILRLTRELDEAMAAQRSDTGELWMDECEKARKQRDEAIRRLDDQHLAAYRTAKQVEENNAETVARLVKERDEAIRARDSEFGALNETKRLATQDRIRWDNERDVLRRALEKVATCGSVGESEEGCAMCWERGELDGVSYDPIVKAHLDGCFVAAALEHGR